MLRRSYATRPQNDAPLRLSHDHRVGLHPVLAAAMTIIDIGCPTARPNGSSPGVVSMSTDPRRGCKTIAPGAPPVHAQNPKAPYRRLTALQLPTVGRFHVKHGHTSPPGRQVVGPRTRCSRHESTHYNYAAFEARHLPAASRMTGIPHPSVGAPFPRTLSPMGRSLTWAIEQQHPQVVIVRR